MLDHHPELRANSRSRPGVTYRVYWGHGRAAGCTCPQRTFRPSKPCDHMLAAQELFDILSPAGLGWEHVADEHGVVEIPCEHKPKR